ncbi:MAG: DUF4124 domain-containing protein [Chitinivorax sp.]
MRLLLAVIVAAGAAVLWLKPALLQQAGLTKPPGSSAKVVKWRDANGQTVFGDAGTAPAGAKTETVTLAAPNVVSLPKAAPASPAHTPRLGTASGSSDEVIAPPPQPRNLALERIEATFSGAKNKP